MKKQVMVVGLGHFGSAVARALSARGTEVLAVDKDAGRVRNVSQTVAEALCFDAGEKPRLSALWWAYAVIGTAVALGLIGAIVGIIEAARHHATMWPWPAAGLAVIALGYGLGVFLATKVVRKATS